MPFFSAILIIFSYLKAWSWLSSSYDKIKIIAIVAVDELNTHIVDGGNTVDTVNMCIFRRGILQHHFAECVSFSLWRLPEFQLYNITG